jgi:HAE1 family hydrophobic/amphiphilic exporter-1
MATLPIAIGYGAGGESRSAMGIAVVGGLLFSQLITLYLTPVVYVTLDRIQASFRKKKGAESVAGRSNSA